MTERTQQIYDEISDLVGGGAHIEDLLNELIQATRDDTAEDVVIDLRDTDQIEAAEFVKVNYLG